MQGARCGHQLTANTVSRRPGLTLWSHSIWRFQDSVLLQSGERESARSSLVQSEMMPAIVACSEVSFRKGARARAQDKEKEKEKERENVTRGPCKARLFFTPLQHRLHLGDLFTLTGDDGATQRQHLGILQRRLLAHQYGARMVRNH